jgi:hypothetical protein
MSRANSRISEAITVESQVLAEIVDPVIRHIDEIHGVPALTPIPVVLEGSRLKPGAYEYARGSGRPVRIAVRPDSLTPRLTFAHEVWHFMEHQGIGQAGDYTTDVDPHLRPVVAAIMRSKTAQYLKELQHRRRWLVEFPDGSQGYEEIDRSYVDYLLRPRELLARAYAQYITAKSGDPRMIEEVNRIRRRPQRGIYYPEQWDDREFETILEVLDSAILGLGWKK